MKPSDPIGAAIVEGMWVEDTDIALLNQVSEAYRVHKTQRAARAEELERARDGVQKSLQSDHDEAMHSRLRKIAGDADRLAEDAGSIADTAASMAHTGEMAQMEMLGIVNHWRPIIEAYCRSGLYIDAAVALFCVAGARAEVANTLSTAIGDAQAMGTRLNSNLATITPGSWATSGGRTQTGGSGNSSGSGVQAVDHTIPKQDGGNGNQGSGRFGGNRDQQSEGEGQSHEESQPDTDEKGHEHREPGRRSGDAQNTGGDQTSSGDAHGSGQAGRLSGTAEQTAAKPSVSSLPTSPVSGAGGSGSGLSGASGMTSPASGLGGLGRSPMEAAGLNGAVKPPVAPPIPSTAPAGGGAGAGSGGSGAGAGRLGGVPAVPAAPVTTVAAPSPVSGTGAAPAVSPTPGFGASAPAAQSVPHSAGPVGGPMGMPGGGGMAAAPVAPPPAAPVGPAPTPSPGLSQGSGAPVSPAAAAANAGLGGSAISAGAAPFSSSAPERVDRFAQMAVEAVKMLAPAIAPVPGLVLAAAVVASGGSPETVIMTNDGAGWLPEGFFLPPTMLHAAVDLDDEEFDAKWFGWADPARTLIDYVVMRDKRSHREVRLLGLASMGPLSEQTKTIFPEAVPSVTAERDAQALTADRGRNAHRLKVQDKEYYEDVRRAGESGRRQLANQALEAVMNTSGAEAIRPQWELLLRDGWLPDAEWDALKARYDHERMMVGALRPGFTVESAPGQAAGLMYVNRFWALRAMETLLLWGREECPVEDVVYTASAAGATIGPVPV
ncbi:hypothetical protein [Mycolicibacterium porcinum]